MKASGTIIVGACQAGLQVAVSLREFGYEEPITLMGDEQYAPYQRPPLSKTFIKSASEASSLALRNDAFFSDRRIDLRLGISANSFNLRDKSLLASTGESVPFDNLVLAVGARPQKLKVKGARSPSILELRSVDDALQIRAAVETASKVVVIGGGFIGLELAATIVDVNRAVTVIESSDRLMARAVAPEISAYFERIHKSNGVNFHFGSMVDNIISDRERMYAVVLNDGSKVEADLVVVGVGVVPRTELADQAGIAISHGIVVDLQGRTSAERVYAAGDCTVHPHPYGGGALLKLESVQNAIDQAKAVAAAMVGRDIRHDAVPWFWSDQGNSKLQIAGVVGGPDETILRGDPEGGSFSALRFNGERLVAVDSVNSSADHMAARKLIASGRSISRTAVTDTRVPLKSLLVTEDRHI